MNAIWELRRVNKIISTLMMMRNVKMRRTRTYK